MAPAYLLYVNDDSGRFPRYRTTEGQVCVVMFRSRDAARTFVDGINPDDELKIVETSQVDTVEWLRHAMSHNNASVMAIDPDPTTFWTDTEHILILPFLIEMEPD